MRALSAVLVSAMLLAVGVAAQSPITGTVTVNVDGTAQQASDLTMQPPIEIGAVWGCSDDTTPRATTAGCKAGDSLTISGRYFGRNGARVLLVPETKGLPNSLAATPVDCGSPRHSPMLPSLLIFCEVPAKAPGDAPDAAPAYHVRVVAHNGISAVKRRAMAYLPDEAGDDGDKDSKTGGRRRTDQALRLLDPSRWQELGIGGLGPQFKDLFRRAFGSRLGVVSPIVQKTGMRHVKGVIFHGLPGTGKTLVARKVAEALGSKNVRVVNGPEIMSKFVGDSERNLRDLFSDAETAWEQHGEASPLYVIVIDEIDAIMRNRGSSRSDDSAARAVYDGVTTQMLAYMDGMKVGNNLLIIGLTNRLDALDPALLRPGRFEVQIRFPLPDRDGRRQILGIHTKMLRENNFIGNDVSIDGLVDATAAFSGADLAATVRSATSYAMARVYESAPANGDALDDAEVAVQFRVTAADFRRGMREVLNAKSASANTEPYLKHGFVSYHERVEEMMKRLQRFAKDVKDGAPQTVMRVLIEGPHEAGLTATAAAAARLAEFPHVHVFSPDALLGLSAEEKVERLRQAFDAAMQAPAACIILDSVEHLLEYNAAMGRVTTSLQIELNALLRRRPHASARQGSGTKGGKDDEVDGRVLVIATTSVGQAIKTLGGGAPIFDAVEALQPLSRADVAVVLAAYRVGENDEERRKLAVRLPPAVPMRRLVKWISVANARVHGSGALLIPDRDSRATIDLFASAETEGQRPQPISLRALSDVLAEFGVLDDPIARDRLAEVVQW